MRLDKFYSYINTFFKLLHKRRNLIFKFTLISIITIAVIFVSTLNKGIEADSLNENETEQSEAQNTETEDEKIHNLENVKSENENEHINEEDDDKSIETSSGDEDIDELDDFNFQGTTILVKTFTFGDESIQEPDESLQPVISFCDDYNYKIHNKIVNLDYNDYSELLIKEFKKEDYDIAIIPYKEIFSKLNSENLLSTIPGELDVQYIEMDGENLAIAASLFNVSGLFYNKRIIEDTGLEDPLLLYKRGEWNLDNFYEYLKKTTTDIDNDGTNDVYGLVISEDLTEHLAASNNADIVIIDNEEVEFNVNDPNMLKVLEFINTVYANNYKGGLSKQGFINNRAVFYNDNAKAYTELSNAMEEDIGFIPYPSDYGITTSSASNIKLFVTNKKIDPESEKYKIIEVMLNGGIDVNKYYMEIFKDKEIADICTAMMDNIYINPIHRYNNLYTLYLDMLRDIKVGMGLNETIDKYDQSKDKILNAINN